MQERDRIAEPWGERTPDGAGQPWPVRVDPGPEGDSGPVRQLRWRRPPRCC